MDAEAREKPQTLQTREPCVRTQTDLGLAMWAAGALHGSSCGCPSWVYFYACAVHPWGRSWGQGEHDCQWRSTKAGNNLYKSFLPFHRVGSRAGTEATSLAASIPKPSSPRAAQPHPLPSRPAFFNPSHLLFYNLTFQDGCMCDTNGTIRTSLRTGSLCPAQLPADSPTPFTRDQSCQ